MYVFLLDNKFNVNNQLTKYLVLLSGKDNFVPIKKQTIMASFIDIVLVASDGSANATTISVNTEKIEQVRPASTSEIDAFSTAVSAVVVSSIESNSIRSRTYLTATSRTTIKASIASANAGVLGAGVSGQTTLVAGTKAITIAGLTTSSIALVTLVSSLTGSSTVTYQAVCTANTLTLRANVAAGTINASDVSILNYAIVG